MLSAYESLESPEGCLCRSAARATTRVVPTSLCRRRERRHCRGTLRTLYSWSTPPWGLDFSPRQSQLVS